MDMQEQVTALFTDYSVHKLEEMTGYLDKCMAHLTNEQVWRRQGAYENSVGNLILHLCGNMRQWILHGIDGQPDVRVRDAEFATDAGAKLNGPALMHLFRELVREVKHVVRVLPAERLIERTSPQPGRPEVSVLGAVYQVVGHVQQHVGQIIFATKQMVGGDLDLTMPRAR